MTVFLITTATVLFIMLVLNFGYYYFKKIYPFLLGEVILWDNKLDRLKLLIGITTLFFAYFSFQSIWTTGIFFKELNIILYAILLASNILFYVIYTQDRTLFKTPSLTENSEEKKKIEEQIRKQILKEQDKMLLDQKVQRIQKSVMDTINFIKEQRAKSLNKYSNPTSHKRKNKYLISNSFILKNINLEKSKKIAEEYLPYFNNDASELSLFISNPLSVDLTLNCTYTSKNRQVSYIKIFELLNTICSQDILDLFDDERSKMHQFIISNFKRGGQSIDKDNLKSAFSKWRSKNA
ncbi:hypothetical protein HX052_12050 [Myroides marinus]|uniref:hypothetical protein n=1 Tax=Myroides marinus TaxID=703342 RepID=UPI0025783A5C|nr:hypothetical protein [Myroides marinus]MDM1369045.1 hypothetical protein [Myroides marinus]MDM1372404.1 hypothetical protein [Myroides marinus]MDM1390691.1 hypothetical protein [Myroides marinus]